MRVYIRYIKIYIFQYTNSLDKYARSCVKAK